MDKFGAGAREKLSYIPSGVLRGAAAFNRQHPTSQADRLGTVATLQRKAEAMMLLRDEIKRGIAQHQFVAHYQPVVSLFTGQVTGFEALVRWIHPRHGSIAPAVFMPMAEDLGLMAAIDRSVLRQACRQLGQWLQDKSVQMPFSMSVNLSNDEFLQPDLADYVDCVLNETHLDGSQLRLEIPEQAIAANRQSAITTLNDLKSLQIRLSIDDFGRTDESVLGNLHEMPVDTLKLTRSRVCAEPASDELDPFQQQVSQLADDPQFDVVAKGIETEEQLSHWRSLHCEYGQGYWFSRPVDSETAGHLFLATAH